MTVVNGRFDWAVLLPGPVYKVTGQQNALSCMFFHSAVGTNQGVIDVVMGPRQAAVTGVVAFDGTLTQFYSLAQSPWAQGSPEWNNAGLGIEFEGGYEGDGHWVSEPIYDAQVASAARILRDLAEFKGVGVDYWQRPSSLKEHREVYATACPSGRIRWDDILAQVQPSPPPRVFLWGDERAGLEKRGKQQFLWNEFVEVDAVGDYEGLFPGQHWHNEGGKWVQVLP